ncbi:MAG TPA: AAA family ATPase, partial [Dehalococcoidia bacterium]|nr:AAA family ATPase [Dehalococcoidia bacterium]
QTYAHKLHGDCRCGKSHDGAPSAPKLNTNGKASNSPRTILETYDYPNQKSEVVFQTVRYDPKGFSQRRPDDNGGWIWDLKGVEPILYRIPELLAADPSKPVFIPEGEKHVDRLIKLGLVATTFPMGALNSHRTKNVSALKDRHVVPLPDNDPPNLEKPSEHRKGQKHAQQIAERLYPIAKSVRVLDLPGLPEKGDVLDWLDAGNSIDDLMDLARHCPEWNPDEAAIIDEGPEPDEVRLHITNLRDVVREDVAPLWDKRIFRGKLAVMAGDPGVGKSYASLDIAARVSLGGPWPDGSGYAPKGNVLLLSAEDGLADTVKPRLELLGADMNRIHSLGLTVSKGAEEIGLSLQQHLREIERSIVENDIILMVVDPLLAFTGKIDTHKSAETRALLSPMAAMAERTGCAILAVMHPNKNSQEGNLLYRISASLDFAAAARSVMVV